jgi:broad specificity phosphatase PhoE
MARPNTHSWTVAFQQWAIAIVEAPLTRLLPSLDSAVWVPETRFSRMTRVLLIRHGETHWNRDRRWQGHANIELSEAGRLQAARLASSLSKLEPSLRLIYSSDLRRAHDTARELAAAIGTAVVVDPAWREIAVGSWTGLRRDEIKVRFEEEWQRIAAGEDLARGGGETFAAFSARVVGALEALRERHPDQLVAVVTHGGAVSALLLHVLELPWARIRDVTGVPNTALNELVWSGTRWTVTRRNHVPHLEDFEAGAAE